MHRNMKGRICTQTRHSYCSNWQYFVLFVSSSYCIVSRLGHLGGERKRDITPPFTLMLLELSYCTLSSFVSDKSSIEPFSFVDHHAIWILQDSDTVWLVIHVLSFVASTVGMNVDTMSISLVSTVLACNTIEREKIWHKRYLLSTIQYRSPYLCTRPHMATSFRQTLP